MDDKIDRAARLIAAPATRLYAAFAQPGAMERWMPPPGMRGKMLRFDFRPGGCYRIRLTYDTPSGQGKTSPDADEAEVRIVRLEPDRLIEQEVMFESGDPAYAGTMRMTWTFEPGEGGTLVTVSARDVPTGIGQADHQAAMAASLDNLAAFVEAPA